MPRKLLLAATLAAFGLAAGAAAITTPPAHARDATAGATQATGFSDNETVAEQGKKKKKKRGRRGAPPRGSSHGSNSGE